MLHASRTPFENKRRQDLPAAPASTRRQLARLEVAVQPALLQQALGTLCFSICFVPAPWGLLPWLMPLRVASLHSATTRCASTSHPCMDDDVRRGDMPQRGAPRASSKVTAVLRRQLQAASTRAALPQTAQLHQPALL